MRRKTYIVASSYTAVRTYEVLANSAEEAKQLVRDGHRAGNIDIKETFNIIYAHRKEKQTKLLITRESYDKEYVKRAAKIAEARMKAKL